MPGEGPLHPGHLFRRALGYDLAAAHAAARPKVEDVVDGLDDVEIVLDHHHRIALVHQPVEHFEELADILEMEARGGLVEDVERLAGAAFRQFLGQFHALRLSAR